MGFSIFNLLEGIVDHHILGIHHVNEIMARDQWVYWDVDLLVWGAATLIVGWALLRAGEDKTGQRMT